MTSNGVRELLLKVENHELNAFLNSHTKDIENDNIAEAFYILVQKKRHNGSADVWKKLRDVHFNRIGAYF
jgi:hypothetical protein